MVAGTLFSSGLRRLFRIPGIVIGIASAIPRVGVGCRAQNPAEGAMGCGSQRSAPRLW
jgi:hypothetical protein